MRITFLTGSLAPGADGVGDYTRILAEDCALAGHSCQTIAVADRHLDGTSSHRGPTDVLRSSGPIPWRRRRSEAENAIRAFAPECVSVQFVPFSYQRWGIASRFVRDVPRIAGNARLHIMLHEIWIGADGSWKRRLISEAQRRTVRQ